VDRLILLTQQEFADLVARPLRAATPARRLDIATTLTELESALVASGRVRLISFGGSVIVPAALLARCEGGAYNFHPGPPEYPGIFPSVFALYDNAAIFGVTLHEMTVKVDSGPIVEVARFPIAKEWNRLQLDSAAFSALLGMLAHSAAELADVAKPLSHAHETWGVPYRTRHDFEALCRLPEDATAAEFTRRYRAIGEGPEHAITVTRFGRTFKLEPQRTGTVVRGGQAAVT